ncbi:molybdenum cofactor biosynthesis protein MoaE, partial [Chloroflexota bacterium]
LVVSKVKNDSSGCVVTYIGLIRGCSQGKAVLSVEYEDAEGRAKRELQAIADEIKLKWQLENVAICHRIGKLRVGDINLVVAIASAHRREGFAACQYAINQFKQKLPTQKKETYQDGSILG